jgi:cell division protein ZapB
METEFKGLKDKLTQIVQFCQRLRAENFQLRQQLVNAQNESRLLNEKVKSAQVRLEALLERLPASPD